MGMAKVLFRIRCWSKINYRPQSEGDNVLGSVRPSVCPSVCPTAVCLSINALMATIVITSLRCLSVCNQGAYADNRAYAVDRLLIERCTGPVSLANCSRLALSSALVDGTDNRLTFDMKIYD